MEMKLVKKKLLILDLKFEVAATFPPSLPPVLGVSVPVG